ncbi:MAG: hypothetical protein LBF22_02740 [Deltaproteobacteria bacterium]|nr:hypothetical protein [Deltaproteobacteria bacterium]
MGSDLGCVGGVTVHPRTGRGTASQKKDYAARVALIESGGKISTSRKYFVNLGQSNGTNFFIKRDAWINDALAD